MKARWFGLAAVSCGLFSLVARANDWPQWLGPQRDGISQETGLLKAWAREGPKRLWQVKDVGYGFGSLAVAGGRVYLLSNEGLENEFLQARSARDGSKLWAIRLGK